MIYQLFLPFPPSINGYYTQARSHTRGRPSAKFVSGRGRQFRAGVVEDISEQIGSNLLLDSRLRVVVCLHPPDARVRDLDNYIKPLFDSLTEAKIWVDDEQVDQFEVYRGVKTKGGITRISISEAGPVVPNDYWPD